MTHGYIDIHTRAMRRMGGNEETKETENGLKRIELEKQTCVPWAGKECVILIAASPHSKRAMCALPILIDFLRKVEDVAVAVDETIKWEWKEDVGTVKRTCGTEVIKEDGEMKKKRNRKNGKEYHANQVDLVICLGGDGLIFHVLSDFFPDRVPPFMPFNMGSLGFLTPFDFAKHEVEVMRILKGENKCLTMRMRLKCVIVRQECWKDGSGSGCIHNFQDNMLNEDGVEYRSVEEYHVLNELVIDRGPAPYLSNLEVLCDDCPVTRVQADGLIVATPTGSTAYSLSSGGSMVHPSVPAILFTPICPHSLSFRPVLFPDHVTLQIKVPTDSRATAWVSFDGRHRMELMKGDKVVVSVSAWCVPTFSRKDSTNDWFASVSQCLRWNERVVQGGSKEEEKEGEGV